MLSPAREALRFEFLWKNVDKRGPDECWLYCGSRKFSSTLRPQMHWERTPERHIRKVLTHVVLYQLTGKWPTYVEHSCDNWSCCNPAHLIESDHQHNMASMSERNRTLNGQKTHCPQGHPYAEFARIGTRGNGKTFRICKACERERTWEKRGAPGKRGPKRLDSATAHH